MEEISVITIKVMIRKQLDVRKSRAKCKIGENKNEHSSQHTIVVSTNTSNNYRDSGTEGLLT